MTKDQIIEKTKGFVREKLTNDTTGHDFWHVCRVWNISKYIAKHEVEINYLVLELAALLHDVADWKFHNGNETIGTRITREWLKKLGVQKPVIIHVENIIKELSFKGALVSTSMSTIEGKIVQDADRLDAIGAIGISRAFTYGGSKKRIIYDPKIKPSIHKTFKEYKLNSSTTINHFYEKLLLLKDRMYTKTAKKIARKRHKIIENYLNHFYREWEGFD